MPSSKYVPPSVQSGAQTQFTFTVTFGGTDAGVDKAPIQLVQTPPRRCAVKFAQSDLTPDKYTIQV